MVNNEQRCERLGFYFLIYFLTRFRRRFWPHFWHRYYSTPTKRCSHCAEWIPRKALKCSHCGSEQPQPIPRRFQPAKKFFLLFLVGFLGIAASVLWLMAFPPG